MVEMKTAWRWSVAVALILLLLVMGLMMSASYWLNAQRDALAVMLSETLGREVSLNGELALGLSLYPTLPWWLKTLPLPILPGRPGPIYWN
ncbi:MAG: hypothetical protein M3H12_07435 [Chromatiales bacterium]|nr:hypothetical protein [Gammaproteobacteria bacterium]